MQSGSFSKSEDVESKDIKIYSKELKTPEQMQRRREKSGLVDD